jgi:deoxyribodipyrimidine photolyase
MRPDAMVAYYVEELRPSAMYRTSENPLEWADADEKLGAWKEAFTGAEPGLARSGAGDADA